MVDYDELLTEKVYRRNNGTERIVPLVCDFKIFKCTPRTIVALSLWFWCVLSFSHGVSLAIPQFILHYCTAWVGNVCFIFPRKTINYVQPYLRENIVRIYSVASLYLQIPFLQLVVQCFFLTITGTFQQPISLPLFIFVDRINSEQLGKNHAHENRLLLNISFSTPASYLTRVCISVFYRYQVFQ